MTLMGTSPASVVVKCTASWMSSSTQLRIMLLDTPPFLGGAGATAPTGHSGRSLGQPTANADSGH
eukprot:7598618-Alexandrium_andersonii.AAC.1